jgi:hypothetical protein
MSRASQVHLDKHLETAEKRMLARAANIGVSLVSSATNAIDDSTSLQGAFGSEAEGMRDETESILRWKQVLEEVDALRSGIVGGMTIRRHRVGGVALRVYKVSRQLALYKQNADLLPHIDAMKRAASFGRRRVAAADPPAPGAPAKPPVQPPPQDVRHVDRCRGIGSRSRSPDVPRDARVSGEKWWGGRNVGRGFSPPPGAQVRFT